MMAVRPQNAEASPSKEELSSTEKMSQHAVLNRLRSVGMSPQDLSHHKELPRASVLVPLFVRGSVVHVLLTKRLASLRTHAGEVCFPGGKQDPQDEDDDVATALREANEEVGLDPAAVKPMCRLETIESYTGLCVTPIVGLVEPAHAAEPSKLTLSEAEVDAAFAVPLAYFLEDKNLASKQEIEWRGGMFVMRTYHYAAECGRSFKIWGLTAHIAHQVAHIAHASGASVPSNVPLTPRSQQSVSGYLFRLQEDPQNSFWVKRYFVCTGQMLHQYQDERQAERKSATKKNRIPLMNCEVSVMESKDDRSEFIVSALLGRVQWHLAAHNGKERQRWISALSGHGQLVS